MNATTPTVVYFSIPDLGYPRNARIRKYLMEELAAEIRIPDVGIDTRGIRGSLRRFRSLVRASRGATHIVLAEFGSKYALPALVLARVRRAELIVDGFVGFHETHILDWKRHSPRSLPAAFYRLVDLVAFRAADVYLIDTEVRRDSLHSHYGGSTITLALPVGAPAWAGRIGAPSAGGHVPLRVLYYGNYIPLHGLDVVVDALCVPALRDRVHLTAVGDGGLRRTIEARVQASPIASSVTFVSSVPEDRLSGIIQGQDVVLGVFGTSVKAQSVIANKVWQGLASGRKVLTQQSDALSELAPLVGPQLITVPPGDAEALADALDSLADQAERDDLCHRPESARLLEEHVARRFDEFGRILLR